MKLERLLIGGLFALSIGLTGCDGAAGDLLGLGGASSSDSLESGITPQPKGQKPLAGIRIPGAAGDVSLDGNTNSSLGGESEGLDDGFSGTPEEEPSEEPNEEAEEAAPSEEPTPAPTVAPTSEPSIEPTTEPEPTATQAPEIERDFFFLSYDDSASTAGVELTKYALNNNFLPNPSWARPWEFLNYESFAKQGQESTGKFNVSLGLWKYNLADQAGKNYYDLGVHISAPEITKAERKNINLTLTLDVSGSMNTNTVLTSDDGFAPSLMEIAKKGLSALPESLKPGDRVSLVIFSNSAQIVFENLDVSSNPAEFLAAVANLAPDSGTNLDAGLKTAYQVAQRHYDSNKINRVVMLTDAFANAGEVDSSVIAQATQMNNAEGIYFSGLGFGKDFNEAFLNELTEIGRGAYFSVITENDATRAFQDRFMALINLAARDVQFRLEFPASLKHTGGAAEETSKVQTEVQPTNFSYNTSQYFWEQFSSDGESTLTDQTIKLSILYTDPETFQKVTEVYEKPIGELLGRDINNIKDARIVAMLTRLIKGERSAEETRTELDTLLSDHGSALASEYRRLIEAYIKLKG